MDIEYFPIPGIAFYTWRQKSGKSMVTVVASCGDKLGICRKSRSKKLGGYEFQARLHNDGVYTGMNDRWAPTLKALLVKVEEDVARRYHLITKFSRAEARLELIDNIAGRCLFSWESTSVNPEVWSTNLASLFAAIARPINCQPVFCMNKGSKFAESFGYLYAPAHPIWLFIKLV